MIAERCVQAVSGKEVIVPLDTTEFNLELKNNRLKCYAGLGPMSNNGGTGFYMHPALCFDAHTMVPLGVPGMLLFTRQPGGSLIPKEKRYITEKESDKWYSFPLKLRHNELSKAAHVTFVCDREGDIFEVIDGLTDDKTSIVIRGRHNRKVKTKSGQLEKISKVLEKQDVACKVKLKKREKSGKTRKLEATVKFVSVTMLKPKKNKKYMPGTREEVPVNIVEVKETGRAIKGKEKVLWRIITTLEVKSKEQAQRVIQIYKNRWRIEEMFRVMKKEGFNLEASELVKGTSIRKLAIMVMDAAMVVEKLKMSRDGKGDIKTLEVFSKQEVKLLELLNSNYEGATQKLKNPYNKEHLAWVAWIIARMGGWNGYRSQRPPGPITFWRGLERFKHAFFIYKLTN